MPTLIQRKGSHDPKRDTEAPDSRSVFGLTQSRPKMGMGFEVICLAASGRNLC